MKKLSIVLIAAMLSILFIAGQAIAAEEKVINWRMISTFPKGSNSTIADKHFIELVDKLTDGKFKISLYGSGELAGAREVLDMVSAGTVQAGGDWPGYWSGKNTAFDLLATNIMGFSPEDYLLWIYQLDGFDMFQKIYGKYNCVYFPNAVCPMESGIRTNKPINSLKDLKGMKIRMGGLMAGKIIQEFGATPVSIAIAELYEAIRRGTLDGAEYSSPVYDKEFHIEEITKYWLTPGWHQTASINGMIMNKKAFAALPEKYKVVVRTAAEATMLWMYTKLPYLSAVATDYFMKYGIKITRLSDAELAEIEAVKNKLQEQLAAQNPDYAMVLKSQVAYQKMFADYRTAQGDFGFGRNPSVYPSIK